MVLTLPIASYIVPPRYKIDDTRREKTKKKRFEKKKNTTKFTLNLHPAAAAMALDGPTSTCKSSFVGFTMASVVA